MQILLVSMGFFLAADLPAAVPTSSAASQPASASVQYTFDEPQAAVPFELSTTGEVVKRKSPPRIQGGKLVLLESWWQSTNAVAFAAPTADLHQVVEVSWTLIMNTGTEGAGFVWLDTERHKPQGPPPNVEAWEAPSLRGAFGVGFDASDPPNRDPFRGSGNAYDRPQHEVSLHWDGYELHKRVTPVDFRDEKPHAVRLRIEFVVGGAAISLWLDDAALYAGYFIPGMTAYVGRPASGARNAETAGDVLLDDLRVTCTTPLSAPKPPLTVVALDHRLNDKTQTKNVAEVDFPENTDAYGRIVCTLRLDEPEAGYDPWDRLAQIHVYDADGTRYELLRYITPYDRGHMWKVDVSDFRPLLCGKRKIEQECVTYAEGWLVTLRFDFYPGPAEQTAYRVVNLWSGQVEVGNPDKPPAATYVPRSVPIDEQTVAAKVRICVTGHGMSPNSQNAAEFMPLGRTLTVNGQTFKNTLWKTDNYLNPCRPQGGTWKYDRAGWAPGDVVRPWEVDVTPLLAGKRDLQLEYQLDDYVNENRGQTWAPFHATEAQVILYRRAQ